VVLRAAQLSEETRRLAVTDPLTGLHNRRYFMGQLEEALRRARRYRESFAVVLLDVDRFKAVNDRHGHAAGDRVLKSVGAALGEWVRETDQVARIGGDEFAALLIQADARRCSPWSSACARRSRRSSCATATPSCRRRCRPHRAVSATARHEEAAVRADAALYDASGSAATAAWSAPIATGSSATPADSVVCTTASPSRSCCAATASRRRSTTGCTCKRVGLDQQRGELVAADASHLVGLADPLAERRAHALEHTVAGRVAVAVVDRLEAVHVEQHHGEALAVAPGPSQRLLELAHEVAAVVQAGERVRHREPSGLLRELGRAQHHCGLLRHDGQRAQVVRPVGGGLDRLRVQHPSTRPSASSGTAISLRAPGTPGM